MPNTAPAFVTCCHSLTREDVIHCEHQSLETYRGSIEAVTGFSKALMLIPLLERFKKITLVSLGVQMGMELQGHWYLNSSIFIALEGFSTTDILLHSCLILAF